jgi:hypothetical protein
MHSGYLPVTVLDYSYSDKILEWPHLLPRSIESIAYQPQLTYTTGQP